MSAALISALSVLTKPVRGAQLSGTQTVQHEALLCALQRNQTELKEQLLAGGELHDAHQLLEEVRREVGWFCSDTEDLTWSFVQECLLLLLCLARHLNSLLEAFNQDPCHAMTNPHTPEAAPPLPPDVLSVAQQKTLGTVLQFLVTLGLCPYLAPGVGVGLNQRSAFGAAVERAVRREAAPPSERRLLVTTTVLMEVASLSSLATLVFTRHLGDLMAALSQLGFRPHRPEGDNAESSKGLTVEERKNCKEALQSLLGRVYQPIVIKELLVLQGGPKVAPGSSTGGRGGKTLNQAPSWLRRLCGQLLSERLMQPHGVQAVIRAILEGAGGGDTDWRKCDAVAKILATCPQQSLSTESYYSQVCPQVLELLHFKDKVTSQQFQQVATSVVLTMVQDQPELALRFLLSPLLSPLQRCAAVPEASCVKDGEISQAAVAERELTCCVEDVYKICVVGNRPSGILLSTLNDVVPTIFSLFCFTKQNVSHLRTPCQEILLWYLSHTEGSSALSMLKGLCVSQADGGAVTPGYQFSPGSDGGAKLTQRGPISDEDDALYEKVSGEQWRLECLVQLLAEMKDSDLPGNLFLLLLQDLTGLAAEQQQQAEKEVDTSAMTLLELEQHLAGCVLGQGERLVLLQILAVMCEGLPHTLLLRKATQVVDFIESMLQRACVGVQRGYENPVESQTISMGMGLIATLISGATQLTAEDYSSMSRLLAPLEQVSQQHPDPVIQELASDLRATIATHGAYCPGSVVNAARQHTPGASTQIPVQSKSQNKNAVSTNTSSTRTPLHVGQPQPIHLSPSLQFTSSSFGSHSSSVSSSGPSPPHQRAARIIDTSCAEVEDKVQIPSPSPQNGDQELSKCIASSITTHRETSATTAKKPLTEWLMEACDPDVPTRAMALRALTHTLRERDKEALECQDKLLTLFLENLAHEDSFVYLSAIQGLVVLADSFPEQILQRLLVEYKAGSSAASPNGRPSVETRLKVGEALMRASRAMGDLAPHYGRPLIGAFLSGTRDEDSSIRASSLSNLGELCQRLQFSLGPLAQELSTCLTALIKTEKEVEVRRATVHVITLLLRGLSDKTTQVLRDVLLELYRALKWVVRSDSDEVTVLHAQLALEELDDVMRRFIFPQQKLEKKIVVLP